MRYLPHLQGPQDLKRLSIAQLTELSAEIRHDLIERVQRTGGHIGSNLGLVEATVALHYVFDSPRDHIVYDVSHQSYVHKMLTGRYAAFMQGATSGYTNPHESDHDPFMVGHTSTAVSLAVGLAKGRNILGGTERIVAVMGDGSLSGGEAYEGLDNAATIQGNLVIVLNDNEMSIADNHGGIYRGLSHLRATKGAGQPNLFAALGLDYMYVEEGNDVAALVEAFGLAAQYDHPVVVHIHTQKGKGLPWAEVEKERGHWIAAADYVPSAEPTMPQLIADRLLARIEAGDDLVVINAANPASVGLSPQWRRRAGDHFVDVGICEEHAVAMASGVAKRGVKAVWLVLSSFVQRAYDQLSQDLALNGTPAVVVVYNGGMSYGDPTHAGLYDVSMMSNVPGLKCLAPTTRQGLFATLDWALGQTAGPVVIRVPQALPDLAVVPAVGRWTVVREGRKVAVLGLGDMAQYALEVSDTLAKRGVNATIVACDLYSSVDEQALESLLADHDVFVTLENGILDGGFGQKVAAYLADKACKVLLRGADKAFVDRRSRAQQLEDYRMTPEQILEDVEKLLR